MATRQVQQVLADRYADLVQYAYGVLEPRPNGAAAERLAKACRIVRRAAFYPIRGTDDEIYAALRDRVLRRALRSTPRRWSPLSRTTQVAPSFDAAATAVTPPTRAVQLLHRIDDLPIDEATAHVSKLARRSATATQVEATDRPIVDHIDTQLGAPSILAIRVPWLIALGVLIVAAGVVPVVLSASDSDEQPYLGVTVTATMPEKNDPCALHWPTRGTDLGEVNRNPLIRHAIEAWKKEPLNTGLDLVEYTEEARPSVRVLYADAHTAVLCQSRALIRYVDSPDLTYGPDLTVTELPYIDSLTKQPERIPFIDLGGRWLLDPDATGLRHAAAADPEIAWKRLRPNENGVTPDPTFGLSGLAECTSYDDTPVIVQVELSDSPRYQLPPLPKSTVPKELTAVHRGEEADEEEAPVTLLPTLVWSAVDSDADVTVLRSLACDGDLAPSKTSMAAPYTEIESLTTLTQVRLPGGGVEQAFQARMDRWFGDGSGGASYAAGVTQARGHDGVAELTDLGDSSTAGVAGWWKGPQNRWYFVAVGDDHTDRIRVVGDLTASTDAPQLIVKGPTATDRYGPPALAVAFEANGKPYKTSNYYPP